MIKQAIIVAGGLGKRMGKLTTCKPKCLLEISGFPILKYLFDGLIDIGIEKIIIAISDEWGKEIEKYTKKYYPLLRTYFSYSSRKGVAYSIYCARSFVTLNEPILITVSDVICFDGYHQLKHTIQNADLALGISTSPLISGKKYTFAFVDKNKKLQLHKADKGHNQAYPLIGVYAFRPVKTFFENLSSSVELVTNNNILKNEAIHKGIINSNNEFRLSFVFELLNQTHHKIDLVNMGDCCEINTSHNLIEANNKRKIIQKDG